MRHLVKRRRFETVKDKQRHGRQPHRFRIGRGEAVKRAGLVNVECPKPRPGPFRPPRAGLAVERDIAGSEVREDPEILRAAAVRPGRHDQSQHAALDLPLELGLEVDGRRLVGLGGEDADRRAIRAHPSDRLSHLAGANLEHRDPLALALEQAQVQDRRCVDHLLAAKQDNMLEALDVGDRQGHIAGFGIHNRGAAMVQVRRPQDVAEQTPEEKQFLVGVGG
ncbi:MAG: hypothetical protein E6I46_01720 [Chloroflexi bacterium]|nr:MAG: hypothetical protein E6I46_01720 [Chloroflexota bacterium]